MATLTGANAYTIDLDGGKSATYQKGETVRPDHLSRVPRKDRKLFSDAPAAEAESDAKPTPKTKK